MAQQITIDIVAETKKLTQGLNEAQTQLGGLDGKLKGLASAATAAASAFVLREGVSFLKEGIAEAKDAQIAMNNATSAFGAGSSALAKITADAEKFGKALAVDNDDIIKLSTQLGTYLPADSKKLSAELVNLGYDISAVTGVDVEAWTKKFAKGMADGELKASDLEKMLPGLSSAIYAQAEAMFKAGKSQDALNLLIEQGAKVYGDAAEKNVTAAQKFDVALANLKETIGTKVLPIVEKFIGALVVVIDKFSALPGPVQNVILVLTGLLAIGVPFLGFLASAKTAIETLTGGIKLAQAAQSLMNFTILGFPGLWVIAAITAVIAIVVLLVKNWDKVTEVVGNVWEAIKSFASNAWSALSGFGSKVAGFVSTLIGHFDDIPNAMLNIGKNIITGLWNGMNSMVSWFKNKVLSFLGNLLPSWAEKALGIASPSKVFSAIGENIVKGLTTPLTSIKSIATPQMAVAGLPSIASPINITINAGLGTDPYKLGKEVNSAISKYGKVSTKSLSTKVVRK